MKSIRSVALILVLALLLSACSSFTPQNVVSFYYPKKSLQNIDSNAELFYAVENREITDNTKNLRYLLSLYFQGPLGSNQTSPFPADTHVVTLEQHAGQLYIQLNHEFGRLNGIDLTLACACISLTCFDLTDANRVTIITPASEDYPAIEITLSRDDLTLLDTVTGKSP